MAGRYTGSYLYRSNGWRAVATLTDIGQASLVGRIPGQLFKDFPGTPTTSCVRIKRAEGVSRTSALGGKPDIVSDRPHVAEVPIADMLGDK
jgi:hypothetical protein